MGKNSIFLKIMTVLVILPCHKYDFVDKITRVYIQHVKNFNNLFKFEISKRMG